MDYTPCWIGDADTIAYYPTVARGDFAGGDFMVCFLADEVADNDMEVFCQRHDGSDLSPVGAAFRVSPIEFL